MLPEAERDFPQGLSEHYAIRGEHRWADISLNHDLATACIDAYFHGALLG